MRRLYRTPRWRALRLFVLTEEPVCRRCGVAFSAVVDHMTPHKGDEALFWDRGNLQGLCKPCHDAKSGQE